jgi:hypothetical protein
VIVAEQRHITDRYTKAGILTPASILPTRIFLKINQRGKAGHMPSPPVSAANPPTCHPRVCGADSPIYCSKNDSDSALKAPWMERTKTPVCALAFQLLVNRETIISAQYPYLYIYIFREWRFRLHSEYL